VIEKGNIWQNNNFDFILAVAKENENKIEKSNKQTERMTIARNSFLVTIFRGPRNNVHCGLNMAKTSKHY